MCSIILPFFYKIVNEDMVFLYKKIIRLTNRKGCGTFFRPAAFRSLFQLFQLFQFFQFVYIPGDRPVNLLQNFLLIYCNFR